MRQLLFSLLAVIILLSQWGWVVHAYHDHDAGEACEVCLTINAQNHAIAPSLLLLLVVFGFILNASTPRLNMVPRAACYYSARAPPSFL